MAATRSTDPYLGNRFLVEIDGIAVAGFAEASGLVAETELDEQIEGGVNDFVHKLPRRTKYGPLTLKRGMTDSGSLWRWHRDVIAGRFLRRRIHLVLLDADGTECWRWTFVDAFPTKWIGPEMKADGSAIAVEVLEVAHHGIVQ